MKKFKYFFFFFILIQGILYLLLIPPWQSPDETHRFGYIVLLSTGEEIWSDTYENLNKEIIDSMVKFNAWKYQNIYISFLTLVYQEPSILYPGGPPFIIIPFLLSLKECR